jgi:hypothetical protein
MDIVIYHKIAKRRKKATFFYTLVGIHQRDKRRWILLNKKGAEREGEDGLFGSLLVSKSIKRGVRRQAIFFSLNFRFGFKKKSFFLY